MLNSIYLIKTLNLIALIFIPLNYVLGVFGYSNMNGLIYLWLCFIGFLLNHFYKKKSKLVYVLAIFLFLPLITAKSIDELIYLIIYCIITIPMIIKGMSVVRYDNELDIFRKGIYLCLGTCIVSFFIGGIHIFTDFSAYYVIIYLVSSVILLRNLRFEEYNMDNKEGRKINNRYSIIIVISSAILSIAYVREIVVKIIKNSYIYIIDLFMYLFAWLFLGIGYLMSIVYNALISLIKKSGIKTQGLESIMQNKKIKSPEVEEGKVLIDKLLNNQIFKIAVKAIVILLIVYIILRIFRGLINSERKNEEYLEEKEFILKSKEIDKTSKNKIFDFIRPRSNEEKIRRYYQKYIKKCLDKNIEIKEIDTTEEIRNKSESKFNPKIIDNIRNIYIKIRYGKKEASKETVKEMGGYYTNIKKN